jgi:hypothetical protein
VGGATAGIRGETAHQGAAVDALTVMARSSAAFSTCIGRPRPRSPQPRLAIHSWYYFMIRTGSVAQIPLGFCSFCIRF